MNDKTQTTVKGIQELGNEVSAWETRVKMLQNESEALRRKNDIVKKEIESSILLAGQDIDRKKEQARLETFKITEATAKLEADRLEFQGILTGFKKERNAFETEKTKIQDLAKDTERLREKTANFILFVRRESEKL